MHRPARAWIVLAAAYGVVFASFMGSIAAGQTVGLPGVLYLSSPVTDNQGSAPAKQKNHDIACLIADGCGVVVAGFVPASSTLAEKIASSCVLWRGQIAKFRQPDIFGALSARGPPARV